MSNGGEQKAGILLRVFNGARQPMGPDVNLLITIRDGFQKQVFRDYHAGPGTLFQVPFYNSFGDNYAVVVSAKGCKQAGFAPVKVSLDVQRVLDLMLLPKRSVLKFRYPDLTSLKQGYPKLYALARRGAATNAAAEARYGQLVQQKPATLAAMVNIATAMDQIHLPQGTALDYLVELIWDDSMVRDRFFAWADEGLIDQVKLAVDQGEFAPEVGAGLFHAGATRSYKQVQFGEANVQLSFHENDTREIGGVKCVKVEPDIDYYKDIGAHALLEVAVNHLTGGLTNPEQVYVLRWIAGRRAGLPEFDPPFTIEAA